MSPSKPEKPKPDKAAIPKQVAFLVAVKQRREATRVYAVLARSPADALTLVQDMAGKGTTVEMAGTLSHRMARSLKLKAEELRLV